MCIRDRTIPSFCYLIPGILLFGLGAVPAIFAIFVYAVPPLIRLTDLGIRLVDTEVIEAAEAFGANKKQKLWGVQLPLALPNIMYTFFISILLIFYNFISFL